MESAALQGQNLRLSGQLAAVSAQVSAVSGQLAAVSAQIAETVPGCVLVDTSDKGRVRPWKGKKVANELLAVAYDDIDSSKAERLRDCASWLEFSRYADGSRRLRTANFCRVRLCPMCQWRRALRNAAQVRRVVDAMSLDAVNNGHRVHWLILTLTIRNCSGDDLSRTLDDLSTAWDRLTHRKVMRDVIGWYRGLEIVHDTDPIITQERFDRAKKYYKARGLRVGDVNPNYDMYHPHYHLLLAVPDSVCRQRYVAIREQWAAAWQSCLRVDYLPDTDVRRCVGKSRSDDDPLDNDVDMGAAVAEVAKYACKDGDYIVPDDWDLTLDTVRLLDKVLDKRRLVAYGKQCKTWHKRLNLQDVDSDNADLVTEDGETGAEVVASEVYYWYTGYRQYRAGGII